MNILVLTSAYPQPDDGNEVVTPTVKYFCEKWVEAGHKVIVIHSNSRFPYVFYKLPNIVREILSSRWGYTFPVKESMKCLFTEIRGVKVYRLPMKKVIPHTKFSRKQINSQVGKIYDILREEDFIPTVVISHWVNPQLDLMLGLKKLIKAKMSLVFHGDCTPKIIRRFNLKSKIKKIDAVGARNRTYALMVKNNLELGKMPFICCSGVPDDKVIAQKKEINNIKKTELHEFIFVGRLVKYKNVDTIICALDKKYPLRNFILHIIGDGREKKSLAKLVNDFNIQKQVVFHGKLNRVDVFELMKKSSCFIMVSDNETFGMVYLEAMMAGCITVASKNGGVDGIIIDGVNGFLSSQGDTKDLVNVLTKIDNMKPEEINKIRIAAVETAYSYRDSEVARKYLENVLNWQ